MFAGFFRRPAPMPSNGNSARPTMNVPVLHDVGTHSRGLHTEAKSLETVVPFEDVSIGGLYSLN